MAATVSRIVLDARGNPAMVIHPDKDSQLDDPAFAPQGTTQYDIPRADYLGMTGHRDLLAAVQPYVAQSGRTVLAGIVQARIDFLDAVEAKRAAEVDFISLAEETGVNPNAAQRIAIATLKARLDAAENDRKAIAAKIQALIASL